MNNTKIIYTLSDIFYYIGLLSAMIFAVCLVSLSGVSVRTVLEAEHVVNVMQLISYSAFGTIVSIAVCVVSRIPVWLHRTAD